MMKAGIDNYTLNHQISFTAAKITGCKFRGKKHLQKMLKKSQFADLDEVFRVEVVKNKKPGARVSSGYAIYNDAETTQDLNGSLGHCFAYGIHSPAEFILSYLESYYIKMPLKTDRKLLRINSVYKPFCKI